MLKYFLLTVGASSVLFVVSVLLHNYISGIWHTEEPFFFVVAVFVAPTAFVVGLAGSILTVIWRLVKRQA